MIYYLTGFPLKHDSTSYYVDFDTSTPFSFKFSKSLILSSITLSTHIKLNLFSAFIFSANVCFLAKSRPTSEISNFYGEDCESWSYFYW